MTASGHVPVSGRVAMRCMLCGAEMRLIEAVPDDTTMMSGYERHTLQCISCNDVERRLVFSREKTPVDKVPAPPTTDVTPGSMRESEPLPAPSVWVRAFAMLRRRPVDKGS
jgi:hypothetical protein